MSEPHDDPRCDCTYEPSGVYPGGCPVHDRTAMPDTVKIRADYSEPQANTARAREEILILCTALDEARAESEALRREQICAVRLAEAAEARLAAIEASDWYQDAYRAAVIEEGDEDA